MKQTLLMLLCHSLILLVALSCKKKKGVLDDLASGRFEYTCIWNKNGIQDTVMGELSGPYLQSMEYYFRVKQELTTINSLKEFRIGTYNAMINTSFRAQGLSISSNIISADHNSNNLLVSFQSGNTLNGSIKLTRKQ